MIEHEEIVSIMEVTSRQLVHARDSAVNLERSRIVGALKAEIQEHLDAEWNHAMRRAIEIVESDHRVMHPVMSGPELKHLAEQVAAKIQRLVPHANAPTA